MAEQQPRRGASPSMTSDIFAGQWPQLRGQIRSWWGQLTDADLDKIAGKKDLLVGLLQERYGYARQRAEQEVDQRFQQYQEQMNASGVSQMGEAVKTTAQEVTSRVTETAGEVRTTVQETAATAASAITNTVKGAGGYLQATGMDQMTGDLAGLIRRYPVSSVLIGFGIGLLVGHSLGKATTTQGS